MTIKYYLSINHSLPTENSWWIPFLVLALHVKTIYFLRTTEFFERYLAIIIFVANHIFSFVIILIFALLAYADAFWIHLRASPIYTNSDGLKYYKYFYRSGVGLYQIMNGILFLIVYFIE